MKNFLIRRSLRIWPLYYLSLFLGFFIFPLTGFFSPGISTVGYQELIDTHLIQYLFFLGNWSAALSGFANGDMLAHLWTISLEEQFYILWPFLLRFLLKKRNNKCAVYFFLGFLFIIVATARLVAQYHSIPHPFIWTSTITRLDPLLVGTLIAFMPDAGIRKFHNRFNGGVIFFLGITAFCVVAMLPNIEHASTYMHAQYPLTAVGAGLLLLTVLNGGVFSRIASVKIAVYVGKISYGCYVYHLLSIAISVLIVKEIALKVEVAETGLVSWLLILVFALLITIIISAVSYSLYEKRWLLLKRRFTEIESRPA